MNSNTKKTFAAAAVLSLASVGYAGLRVGAGNLKHTAQNNAFMRSKEEVAFKRIAEVNERDSFKTMQSAMVLPCEIVMATFEGVICSQNGKRFVVMMEPPLLGAPAPK